MFYISTNKKTTSTDNLISKSNFEDYLLLYNEIFSKDLFSKEQQSLSDLKSTEDEEIKIEKNCKFKFLNFSL